MQLLGQLYLVLSLALSFSAVSAAHLGGAHARRHNDKHEVATRPHGDVSKRDTFSNARFTFFADGLGACGATNSPSDFIVALNSAQYGSGGYCFQMITITYNGKTTQAQITDECPGCPYGGLDMSTGLFDFFADPSAGVIYGEWSFGSGGGAPSSSSAAPPPPSSTSPPPPPPTSTWSPPPTTSAAPSTTPAPSTTSTPAPTSTSSSSSSSSVASTATSSNPAVGTSLPLPVGVNVNNSNILRLNQAIVQLGSFLIAADQSQ